MNKYLTVLIAPLLLVGCFDSDDDENRQPPAENSAPVPQSESVTTETETEVTGQLNATDADDDALTFALAQEPSSGSATVASDGAFSYTPDNEVTGEDSFSFTVSDGVNSPVEATVSVTIEAQQISFLSFSREAFAQSETDEPLSVNGRDFMQDADMEGAYDDLLLGN